MPEHIIQIDQNLLETRLDRLVAEKVAELLNAMLDAEADEIANAAKYERTGERKCFASMFVRQVRQCFSAVWADGFPRCRHRFPVM